MSKSWTCAQKLDMCLHCIMASAANTLDRSCIYFWKAIISFSFLILLSLESLHLQSFLPHLLSLLFNLTFSSLYPSFPSPSFSLSNLSHVEWIIRNNEWGNWIFGVVIIRGLDPYWCLMTVWVLDLWVWLAVACGFMVVWAEKYIYLSLKSFISTKSNRVKKYDFLYLCYSQILRLQSFRLRRTSQRRNEPRNKLAQDDVLTCGQKFLLEFLGNGVPWTLNPSIYRVRKVLWWVLDMYRTSQKYWLWFQIKTLIKTSFGGRNVQ